MTVPKGSLAVYSTRTPEDAQKLITAACPLSVEGDYFAPELEQEQTIENLAKFSQRLHEVALRIGLVKEES